MPARLPHWLWPVACAAILSGCTAPEVRPDPAATPQGRRATVVEDTYIVAPRRVGLLALAQVHNYQDHATAQSTPHGDGQQQLARLLSGVQFRYAEVGRPQVFADLYVYPARGGNAGRQLRQEMDRFRAAMRLSVRAGLYSRFVPGRQRTASLHEGDADWPGLMLPMTVQRDGRMLASRTYLFLHHLYFYKLRIDAPPGDPAGFDRRAARFLRNVVAPVETVSTGSCGYRMQLRVTVPGQPAPAGFSQGVSADGTAMLLSEHAARHAPAAYARTLAAQEHIAALRQARRGCVALGYAPPRSSPDRVVVHLHYPPGLFRITADDVAAARRKP